jgi:hypothetical protein
MIYSPYFNPNNIPVDNFVDGLFLMGFPQVFLVGRSG